MILIPSTRLFIENVNLNSFFIFAIHCSGKFISQKFNRPDKSQNDKKLYEYREKLRISSHKRLLLHTIHTIKHSNSNNNGLPLSLHNLCHLNYPTITIKKEMSHFIRKWSGVRKIRKRKTIELNRMTDGCILYCQRISNDNII